MAEFPKIHCKLFHSTNICVHSRALGLSVIIHEHVLAVLVCFHVRADTVGGGPPGALLSLLAVTHSIVVVQAATDSGSVRWH